MAIAEIIKSVKGLSPEDLENFGNELGKNLPETGTSEVFESLVNSMAPEAQKQAVTKAAQNMPDQARKEIVTSLVGSPSDKTRDKLWTIAVWAFSIIMVGSFLFIATGAFLSKPADPVASGDILLSIFTASVGFFAGLFAPSPGK